jgi:hypothetical protein
MTATPLTAVIEMRVSSVDLCVKSTLLGNCCKMRAISLILSVAGTLVLFVVPVKLSIADSNKTDWDNVFPNWRKWLVIGILLIALGVSLPLSG